MTNQTLVSFIRSTKAQGYDEIEIRKGLLKKGWPQKEIDDAFSVINQEKEKKVMEKKKVSEKITPQELKETFSQPQPGFFEKIQRKISFKGMSIYLISFIGILLIIGFTTLVFYYMIGLMDYTVLDPATGAVVNGKCYEENCSDMKESAYASAKEKIVLALLIGLGAAFLIVLIYKIIPWKTPFLWAINILYFAFLSTIIYLWITFTASLS